MNVYICAKPNTFMDTKLLEEIGLTPKEVEIYLTLLSLKSATISEIINKAKVARQSAYEITQKLLDKGLVSYNIKDGKKSYSIANPERLLDIVKEKETGIKTLLPELLAKYDENKEPLNVETFVGKEGIKIVTSNILKVGKPIYALIGKELIIDLLQYHMPQFIKKRTEQKIPAKMIYAESVRKRKMKIPLTELKYVPNESSSPITIIIYGDNVDILIFSEIPIALHMQNNEILQSFMNYFNLMWAIAKK